MFTWLYLMIMRGHAERVKARQRKKLLLRVDLTGNLLKPSFIYLSLLSILALPVVTSNNVLPGLNQGHSHNLQLDLNLHGNTVQHAKSFESGLVSSCLMTVLSEIGDKTFFLAAVMTMKKSRLCVFFGSVLALGVMTIISGNWNI